MPNDMISKPRARRVRLLSQGATLVFAGAAAAAVVFGVPFLNAPSAEPVEYTAVQANANEIYQGIVERRTTKDETVEELPPDLAMIESSLAMVSNAPKVAETTEEPETGGESSVEEPAPVAQAGKARFLGTIAIGDRLLALISAGGGQRVLGEGESATLALAPGDNASPPTVEIRSVSKDEVVLVENGAERTIERAPRSGSAVSTSVASVTQTDERPSAVSGRTEGAFNQTEQIPPVNPDDFRREDGTIDYEALREAARERARQRQEQRRAQREANGEDQN
jgi:type II secretory pathway component PulC